jgi:hypothetical protein
MKRFLFGAFVLLCLAAFIPAAFAAEDVAGTGGTDAPFFNPTLRLGCAVDAAVTRYSLDYKTAALGGVEEIYLERPAGARFYLAGELPFAVTDRLTLALGANWAFSGAKDEFPEKYSTLRLPSTGTGIETVAAIG